MKTNEPNYQTQPEIRFLIECCRRDSSAESNQRITRIAERGHVNWGDLKSAAVSHGVLPLLYSVLKNCNPQLAPPGLMEEMRVNYLQNTARNLASAYRLTDILTNLEKNEIAAVPFKGPTLAEFYFGDLALRQFSDLDILISPEDAPKTFRVLAEIGYLPKTHLNDHQVNTFVTGEYSLEFAKGVSRVEGPVGLHWELTGKFSRRHFGIDRLMPRIKEAQFCGRRVRQMSHEDMLVYLCLHGAKECWRQLGHVCCISELMRSQSDLDWDYIFELAEWLGCRRRVHLGLYLVHDLFEIRLPDTVAQQVYDDAGAVKTAAGVLYHLYFDLPGKDTRGVPSYFSTFHIRANDSHADSIRYAMRTLFQPTRVEWLELPLPPSHHFIHYLYRPFHLITNAIQGLTKPKPT